MSYTVDVDKFFESDLFLSLSDHAKSLCKALLNQLSELGLDYKVHMTDKKNRFTLLSSKVIAKKKDRDFLTVYPTRYYLKLCPKFYGFPWKSTEIKNIEKKMLNTEIEEDYLDLIINAYKSISNEDFSLSKKILT